MSIKDNLRWTMAQKRCFKKQFLSTESCSLCGAECQQEVVSGLVGVEDGVLKGVGEESVHQGAEGDPVFPTGGKVLNDHSLF